MVDDVYMIKFFTLLLVVVGNSSLEEIKSKSKILQRTDVDSSPKIVGGTPTVIEKYPYVVQLIAAGRFHCGGSLITRTQVMLAAHCVDGAHSPQQIQIRMGTSYPNSGGALHDVSKFTMHKFNYFTKEHDIAMVLLKEEAVLSSRVAIAWLPEPDAVVPDNAPVWTVGWGRTESGGGSDVLLEVQVRTVNEAVCRGRYESVPFTEITSTMICAGLLDIGGKSACYSDSGGPLIYKGVVVGVTSFMKGCEVADPQYVAVFTKVASYILWLGENTISITNPNPDNAHAPTPNYVLLPSVTLAVLILNLPWNK